MPKKSAKKVTHAKAKVAVRAKTVSRPAHVARKGYNHSSVLSDQMLILLAVFFALVGLYAVVMYRRQNDDFESFMYQRHAQEQELYRPATPRMMEK